MGPEGLEQSALMGSIAAIPLEGGAKCGATPNACAAVAADPRLARVVGAWATLPEAVRAGIAAMVGAAGG